MRFISGQEMPEAAASYAGFTDFRDAVLLELPPGSHAQYSQAYPNLHPGDVPYSQDPGLAVQKEYTEGFVERFKQMGCSSSRLLVLPDLPTGAETTKRLVWHERAFDATQAAGEEVRVVPLKTACEKLGRLGTNSFAEDYTSGRVARLPRGNIWAVYSPDSTPKTDEDNETEPQIIALVNYNRLENAPDVTTDISDTSPGKIIIAGEKAYSVVFSVFRPPYPPDLLAYRGVWRDLYNNAAKPLRRPPPI